jgi:flagellar hook-associated protein 2
MAIDLTSVVSSSGNSTYSSGIENILQVWMASEEEKLQQLEDQQDQFYQQKTILTQLHSKLSTLKTKANDLKSALYDNFNAKKAKSSDLDKIDVSAAAGAQIGSHTLKVERLATSDTRVSQQYTDTGTSFTSITTDQTFQIEVFHPTETDPENRVAIDVTISASVFQENDQTVLTTIANAINDAMNSAVLGSTILSDEKIEASVVSEEDGVSRLVLRSISSGYDYRMDFTDSSDSLLTQLQVNAATQAVGTSGGYMKAIGTSSSTSELNSKFVLDGLTFYRNTNVVTDALNDVTIQFLDVFDTEKTITVSADVEAVKDTVRAFLDSYNDIINFIIENSGTDAETGKDRALKDYDQYQQIKYDIRGIMMSVITGVGNSSFDRLSSIGITGNDIGTFTITDGNKFEKALLANSSNVADIFTTDDTGLVDQLTAYIDRFVGAGGLINSSKKIIDDRVSYLDQQIDDMNNYLDIREKQLRDQLYKLQQAMTLLGSQQNYFYTYLNRL